MANDVLAKLMVTEDTLTQEEKIFLSENGYLNLGKLLDDMQLDQIRAHIHALLASEGDAAGSELFDSPYIRHPKEAGADRLADLVNKGPIFDSFYTNPRLLAAVAHVLGQDIKLSSLNYRSAKPGMGAQKLHADWHEAVGAKDYKVCNSIWLIDDFTTDNGATRLVPGSHQHGILPQEDLEDPWATHPDEILCTAPAGSVFVVNSHTWHGGTTNRTEHERRSIHTYFCRGDQPQQTDQARFIRKETLSRLSAPAIKILGLNV